MWRLKQHKTPCSRLEVRSSTGVQRSISANLASRMAVAGIGNAGTCQVSNAVADDTLKEIIEKISMESLSALGEGKSIMCIV